MKPRSGPSVGRRNPGDVAWWPGIPPGLLTRTALRRGPLCQRREALAGYGPKSRWTCGSLRKQAGRDVALAERLIVRHGYRSGRDGCRPTCQRRLGPGPSRASSASDQPRALRCGCLPASALFGRAQGTHARVVPDQPLEDPRLIPTACGGSGWPFPCAAGEVEHVNSTASSPTAAAR